MLLNETEVAAPVAEIEALAPLANVTGALKLMEPTLLTEPVLYAVWLKLPPNVVAAKPTSATLPTENALAAPVALIEAEDPTPDIVPRVRLPVFVIAL